MTVFAYLGAVVFLLLAALLRAAGTGVARIPRADALRDSAEEIAGASRIAELLDEREAIAPAVGVVASGLLVLASVLSVAVATRAATLGRSLIIAVGIGAVVFLVGDLLPRALGRMRPRPFAYKSAGPLSMAVRLGGWANDLLPDSDDDHDDDEDDEAEDASDDHERELIDSVLEFGETIVREIMTPRPDMVTIPLSGTVDELIALATDAGYSRIPVIDNGDVAGMVIVRDLLPMLGEGREPASIPTVMRAVEFVPETKLASQLLGEMQEGHNHQMIVIDEYGDVVGLVTIEDLLEELVGEIADETDDAEVMIAALPGGGWDIDARMSTEDLETFLGIEVPDEEWDTVAGLVLGLAERIPEEGEVFHIGGFSVEVTHMQGRRVSQVRVVAQEPVEPQ